MKRFLATVMVIILGLILYQCGGGGSDGGGDSAITTPPVILSGKLDTGSLTANAALSQTVVASLANIALAQATVTDDIWIVAINENGEVQATAQLAQPLDLLVNFILEVPSAHDYVIVFHTGSIAGPVLAVFMIEDAGVLRSVISLPADMNDTDLGTVTIDPDTLTATSDINETLVTLLPASDVEYKDLDKDLIPDDFDWDDDGDGVVDGSGDSTSVYYDLRGGDFSANAVEGSFSTEELWVEGTYDTKDRSFTVYRADAPRLFINTDLVFQQVYPPIIPYTAQASYVWMDSPLSVDKNGRVTSGDLRFGLPWSHLVVSANPDVDDNGTPGYTITLIAIGEVLVTTTVTWDQLDAIGDDPTAVDGYLAAAWLGLRGVEFVFQNAQQILGGFEYCYTNRQALAVAGAGNPVTLACDTFPGDGSQGTVGYTWFDTEPSNPSINPGDSFKITYDNCWLNDDPENPADSIDEIFDGSIDLSLYYDVRNPTHHPNTYMGVSHAVLTNLKRTETVANSIDPGSVTTANTTSPEGPALWIEFTDYVWLEFYEIED